MTSQTPRHRPRWWPFDQGWLDTASKIAALAGAGGLIVYSISYWEATGFYDQFGVDPAEVGLSQTTLVLQAAVKLLTGSALVLFVGSLFVLIRRALYRRDAHGKSDVEATVSVVSRLVWCASVSAVLTGIGVAGYLSSIDFGRTVRRRTNPIHQPFLSRVFLDVKATPVSVAWAVQMPVGVSAHDPLVLLGNANGIIVLYDGADGGMTLRVPVGNVQITACPCG